MNIPYSMSISSILLYDFNPLSIEFLQCFVFIVYISKKIVLTMFVSIIFIWECLLLYYINVLYINYTEFPRLFSCITNVFCKQFFFIFSESLARHCNYTITILADYGCGRNNCGFHSPSTSSLQCLLYNADASPLFGLAQ